MMTKLTYEQIAEIERQCAPPDGVHMPWAVCAPGPDLPATQPSRFFRRIDIVMNVTGRDRGWSRARARELWPGEAQAAEKALAAV